MILSNKRLFPVYLMKRMKKYIVRPKFGYYNDDNSRFEIPSQITKKYLNLIITG